MSILVMDLETIPSEDPAVIAEIAASIEPPGNISKAETIAAWERDKKPALIDEAIKRTSFDGGLGKIICIGFAIDDNIPLSLIGDERDILHEFFARVNEAASFHFKSGSGKDKLLFVGHNIVAFDLRFLWQRAVVHGIKPPAVIPFNVKPWDANIADTLLLWNPERERRTSLDKLCRILGVRSSKGEMDGSMVWDYYKAGRIEEIAAYCRDDIRACRECWRRIMFA